MPPEAKQQSTSGLPSATADNADLQARIKQLEAERDAANSRAESAESRAIAAESSGSDRRYAGDKPVESATKNKPTWPFLVRCSAKPAGHPDIEDATIKAVDESEAIRQFCLMRKDEKGRQLDPTRYQFQASCVDRTREQQSLEKQRHRRAVQLGHEDPRPKGKEHDKSINTRIDAGTRQLVGAGR